MRTYDFAPLYRSTVGFDRLFDMLETSIRPDWPPYNIEKTSQDDYTITMAVAGFAPEEIEVTQNGNQLIVTGQKATEQDASKLLHQGIAFRSFKQSFNLADHVRVANASLVNGLLAIALHREVPEQLKPRKITIGGGTSAPASKRIEGKEPLQPAQAETQERSRQAA